MKILVTGGAGFIGSALIRAAIEQGHSIVNVDALTYAASLSSLATIAEHPNYAFEHVDVRNLDALNTVFDQHRPEAVMHLAAESHVDRSIDGPADFVETNVTGTFNVLEASRAYWVHSGSPSHFRVHHVSTDEVFGSLPIDQKIMFTEKTAYDPRSPYAATKAASDHLVRAWHSTYGLPTIISNCSNNYGPFQFPEKLIPVVILNALAGQKIPIYGNGSNVRDWLFVEDHADALLHILRHGEIGRSYNVGGENECSNLDLVRRICSILDCIQPRQEGPYSDLITFVTDRPGHDARYAIDPSRVRNELGWQPSVGLDAGLQKTINWYLSNGDWWAPLQSRQGVGVRLGTLE